VVAYAILRRIAVPVEPVALAVVAVDVEAVGGVVAVEAVAEDAFEHSDPVQRRDEFRCLNVCPLLLSESC